MKRLLVLLLTLSLAASGCARKVEPLSRTTSLVPSDALAFVTVSLDPPSDLKRSLRSVCTRFKKVGSEDCGIRKLLDDLFGDMGLSYDRDVKPWIGKELAFAVLPPARSGGEPLTVLLVEAADTEAAGKRMREVARKAGDLEYRIVGSFVAVDGQKSKSDRAAALARIEAGSPGTDKGTLAGDSRFASLTAKVHSPHLALGWWDAGRSLQLLGAKIQIPAFDRLLPELTGESGGTMAFALHADADALALEGVSDVGPTTSEPAGVPKLTEGLPADTLAAMTVFGLGRYFGGETAGKGAAGKEIEGFLDEVHRETGLDVAQDVASWMGGELVLAVGPPREGAFPDIGLVVEPTDKAKAAAGAAKIKAAVEKSFGVPLAAIAVGGVNAYAVADVLGPGIQPAMALFDDRFVVASTPAYLTTLSKPATPGLGSTAEYRRITGSGGGTVSAQFVVRLGAVRDAVLHFLETGEKATYDKDVAPWVEPLEALLLRAVPGDVGRFEVKVTTH